MRAAVDHVFICTAIGAPGAERLRQFGLALAPNICLNWNSIAAGNRTLDQGFTGRSFTTRLVRVSTT